MLRDKNRDLKGSSSKGLKINLDIRTKVCYNVTLLSNNGDKTSGSYY